MSLAENVTTLPQSRDGSYEFARFNALQHGVLSQHTVLPWEDGNEYRVLVEALTAEHVSSSHGKAAAYLDLDRSRMDDDPHRQPFAVDQGVDLASLNLLAGVVTHLVVLAAPFSADLTD